MKNAARRLFALLMAAAALAALAVPALATGTDIWAYPDDYFFNELSEVSSEVTNHRKIVSLTVSGGAAAKDVYAYHIMAPQAKATLSNDVLQSIAYNSEQKMLTKLGIECFKSLTTGSGALVDKNTGINITDTLASDYGGDTISDSMDSTQEEQSNMTQTNTVVAYLNTIKDDTTELASLAASLAGVVESCYTGYDHYKTTATFGSDGKAYFDGTDGHGALLYPGYYLLVCENTAPVLVDLEIDDDVTSGTQDKGTVNLKAKQPTPSGGGSDSTTETPSATVSTVSAGDKVIITITSELPTKENISTDTWTYKITDTLTGLSYVTDSVSAKLNNAEASWLTATVDTTTTSGVVVFDFSSSLKATTNVAKWMPGDTITVTFEATVDGASAAATQSSAVITYPVAGSDGTLTSNESAPLLTTVYTCALTLNTVAAADSSTLTGPTFLLKDSEGNYYNNTGGTISWGTTGTAIGNDDTVYLGADTYTLEEQTVSVPSGYNTAGNVYVTVSAVTNEETGLVTGMTAEETASSENNNATVSGSNSAYTVTVAYAKAPPANLPGTGAAGAAVVIALGVAAVIAGVVIFDRKRGRG